jgi:3-oxoacyl-[acyl-carrier protein] reductase
MALLDSQIAVITGAGSSIGAAIAKGFAHEGARVVALDINEDAAAQTAREIADGGGHSAAYALDVVNFDACDALAAEIAHKVGHVSILVNNAGIVRRSGMTGAPEAVVADWQEIIAVNLNSPMLKLIEIEIAGVSTAGRR